MEHAYNRTTNLLVTSNVNNRINIYFSCSTDFVYLTDGQENKKYCGQKIPPSYTSKQNPITVRFVSTNHAATLKPGFVATYTSGMGQGKCDQGYLNRKKYNVQRKYKAPSALMLSFARSNFRFQAY